MGKKNEAETYDADMLFMITQSILPRTQLQVWIWKTANNSIMQNKLKRHKITI